MTTTFLDNNKFPLSKFYCRGASHEKKQLWGKCSFLPPRPTPSKVQILIFIVVSPSLKFAQARSALSGTGDSQRDSRESIRANHSQLKPLFL